MMQSKLSYTYPKGTPTTIILSETGNLPVEHIIKKKATTTS